MENTEAAPVVIERRIWAMERVAAWIDRGTLPEDHDSVPATELLSMEADGMVVLGKRMGDPIVTLTPLGAYEAARLVAHPPAPPQALTAVPTPV